MIIIYDGVSVTVYEIVSNAESGEWVKVVIILGLANDQAFNITEDGYYWFVFITFFSIAKVFIVVFDWVLNAPL